MIAVVEDIIVKGHPLKLYPINGSYSVADEGGWLPGVFDSRESAIAGFKLTLKPNGHDLLAKISKRVNRIENEDRPITLADLSGTSADLRKRRLSKMSVSELDTLNWKLVGKGPHWATQERRDVCDEIGRQVSADLRETEDA